MPPDPTLTVPPNQHLETRPTDIGHVAPSLASPRFFNTLVIRPDFRISLKLGNVEDLFAHEPNTIEGRMERLQVLGLFHFPLKHKRAKDAFNGVASPKGHPSVAAVAAREGAWAYFKRKILGGASDTEADAAIQEALHTRLISGAKAPAFSKTPITGTGLPPAPAEGQQPTKDNWAKIRIPGTYAFITSPGGRNLNSDGSSTFDFTKPTFAMEDKVRADNPVIGAIPLVAIVEKRDPGTTEFKPASGVSVYFQLIKPFDFLRDGEAVAAGKMPFFTDQPCNEQFNRPPLRESSIGLQNVPGSTGQPALPAIAAKATGAGPRKLIVGQEDRQAHGADSVHSINAPTDRGGLRPAADSKDGKDVGNKIFLTGDFLGFTKDHSSPVARKMSHTPFSRPAPVPPDGKNPHAVTAITNADGEAGVIFRPSRCGGDRYRFRVYIGHPTMASDGTEPSAVKIDTGTLVVWRNVRVSRYVQQEVGTPDTTVLQPDAAAPPYNLANATAYLNAANMVDNSTTPATVKGLDTADFTGTFVAGVGTVTGGKLKFDHFVPQLARAFCEVEFDPGADTAEKMVQADWAAARQQAFDDGLVGMAKKAGMNVDMRRLLCMDDASITVANAVCQLPMRSPERYNAGFPPNSPKRIRLPGSATGNVSNTVDRIEDLFWTYWLPGFLRSFSDDGFRPGLTIIQGGTAATWQMLQRTPANPNNPTWFPGNSGVALEYRGCFVWFGTAVYSTAGTSNAFFSYDFNSNVCHECGHNLGRTHGPRHLAGGITPVEHDPPKDSVCVMSYETCEGQYCGKCLMALRGWDISKMTAT